jgi:reticulon-4-interacting protein 1, mitochondrial
MRAWTHSRAGPASAVLTLTSAAKTPTLTSPTAVLVRISYASLNPGGSIMMTLCPNVFRATPAIPELDFSGTLVAMGSDVKDFAVGDKVFGTVLLGPHVKAGIGTLAEYVALEAATVLKIPAGFGEREAAGLPIAACTALVLVETAGLKEGDRVVVNGASGGVGTFAVQMVREKVGKSGKVVWICSGRNAEVVRELGADEVRALSLRL